jgi:hypothetical protein
MPIRDEDLHKIVKRLDKMLDEVVHPDSRYRAVLLVAEKGDVGDVSLALGTNAPFEIAAAICAMAEQEFYAKSGERHGLNTLVNILRDLIEDEAHDRPRSTEH